MNEKSSIMNILLSSETKIELLSLFHNNPSLMDTVEGIAIRIGRTGASIQEDVESLEKIGILRKKFVGHSSVFLLETRMDQGISDLLAQYFESNKPK